MAYFIGIAEYDEGNMMSIDDKRSRLIKIFEDTMMWCKEDKDLQAAIQASRKKTYLYGERDKIEIGEAQPDKAGEVIVTLDRSFEAAKALHKEFPESKITVLNFASATNPGGGVKKGSSAQEEALCRCSTLYPCLTQDWLYKGYYGYHKSKHDTFYTNTAIYTEGIKVIKSDELFPNRVLRSEWFDVDIISCAAPNLRQMDKREMKNPYNTKKLRETHKGRGERIIQMAMKHGADCLILGPFGCGAFQNDPILVANVYKGLMESYAKYFTRVVFATAGRIKDSKEVSENARVFLQILKDREDLKGFDMP